MSNFEGDYEAIKRIIKLGFKLNRCYICLENKCASYLCQICKNEVCIDCNNKIIETKKDNIFICPYCRSKERSNDKVIIFSKNKKV